MEVDGRTSKVWSPTMGRFLFCLLLLYCVGNGALVGTLVPLHSVPRKSGMSERGRWQWQWW